MNATIPTSIAGGIRQAESASLGDPALRGEDLAYNYRLATAIAPERCNGCARYHVNWPLGRLAGVTSPFGSDKREFAASIEHVIQKRSALPGSITMTVIGSADTGVPALLAHGAYKANVLGRSKFMIIDQCDTPLQQCRDYGTRHHLNLTTIGTDVTVPGNDIPSDIVVVHSLLRFIPAEVRVECLSRWFGWLKPRGRMIVSNTFGPQSGRYYVSPHSDGLRKLVERNEIELAEPKEQFLARLDKAPPWPISVLSKDDLMTMFDQAGLVPLSVEIVRDGPASASPAESKGRLVAVFAAAT